MSAAGEASATLPEPSAPPLVEWHATTDESSGATSSERSNATATSSTTDTQEHSTTSASSTNLPSYQQTPFWQTLKTSVRERNKHMFNNELISDAQFSVGKGGEEKRAIPVHKYVLGTASPVFYAMLYGDFAKDGEVISIDDCDYDSFLEMIRFVYCDEVNLSSNNVLAILYLSNKYIIPVLSRKCIDYLMENVRVENVLEVLNAALCFGKVRLEKHCWSILSRQTAEIFLSESFLDVEKTLLINILQRDSLNVHEIDVFKAVRRWAEAECPRRHLEAGLPSNRREVLAGVLELVRFPVMSAKEFALGPARSDLLPLEDIKAIFIYLTSGLVSNDLVFPVLPRLFKPHVCSRYVKPMKNYLWRYDEKDVDAIRFQVDQEIFLTGIGLYGSPCGGEYNVSITIALDSDREVFKKESVFMCPPDPEFNNIDNPQIHQILFEEPVCIKEGSLYDLCVLLDGPPSFAGDDGKQEIEAEGVTFSFENSSDSSNGTSYDEGQIPTLLFYF